jgi:hypothetical protein
MSSHNPNYRATKNYSIMEDLCYSLCAISSLKVLQSCLAQNTTFIYAIRSTDAFRSQLISFDPYNVKPHHPYHIPFHIQVVDSMKNSFRMVINEGASTRVMLLSCWKAIGSLELTPPPTL